MHPDGWNLSQPSFGSYLNPIRARGTDYICQMPSTGIGMSQPTFKPFRRTCLCSCYLHRYNFELGVFIHQGQGARVPYLFIQLVFRYFYQIIFLQYVLNYHQNSKVSQESYLLYLAVDFTQSFVSFDLSPVPSVCKMGHKLTE